MKSKSFGNITNQKYEKDSLFFPVCIGVFLLIKLFLLAPEANLIDQWYPTIYGLDYSYGFIYKGFIGEIMSIVFNNTLSMEKIKAFTLVNWVIVCILICYILWKLLSGLEKKQRYTAECLISIYMIHPYGLTCQMEQINFARTDNFYLTVLLLAVICILSDRTPLWIVAGALCVIGVAIHTIFVVMYMPVIGIIMLYKSFEGGKINKARLTILVLLCAVLLGEYLYFSYWAPTEFAADADALAAEIYEKKGFTVETPEEYFLEYSLKDGDWFGQYKAVIIDYYISCIPSVLLLFVYIVGGFIFIWFKMLKKADNIYMKLIYVLCILSIPVTSLTFISVDWFRWMPEVFLGQSVLFFSLLYSKEISIQGMFDKFSSWFTVNKGIVLLVVILILLSGSLLKYSFFDNYNKFSILQTEFLYGLMGMAE